MSDTKEYVVKSASLYMSLGGKLQKVPQGATVKLTQEQAESRMLRDKVVAKTEAKAVEVGAKQAEKKQSSASDAKSS